MSSKQEDSINDSEKRIAELWEKYRSSIKNDLANIWIKEEKEELLQIENNLEFIERALVKLFEREHSSKIKSPILEINELIDLLKKPKPKEKWIKKISLHLKKLFLELEDAENIFSKKTRWAEETAEELIKNTNFDKAIEDIYKKELGFYKARLSTVAEALGKVPETSLRTIKEANALLEKTFTLEGKEYSILNKYEIYQEYSKIIGKSLAAYEAVFREISITERFNTFMKLKDELLLEYKKFAELLNENQKYLFEKLNLRKNYSRELAAEIMKVYHSNSFGYYQGNYLLEIYKYLLTTN